LCTGGSELKRLFILLPLLVLSLLGGDVLGADVVAPPDLSQSEATLPVPSEVGDDPLGASVISPQDEEVEVSNDTTPREFVFLRATENGEIYSNGSHYTASVSTRPSRITNNETSQVEYYQVWHSGSEWWLKSAYGFWKFTQADGLRLLYGNGSEVWESELWGITRNAVLVSPSSDGYILLTNNSENLTLQHWHAYSAGWLNVSYSWIRGVLKIDVMLQATISGNYRIGLRMEGLDQFSTQDLIHLNTSRYSINFEDMLSHIDLGQSSFADGTLTLVSTVLVGPGTWSLDPSSYEISDDYDLYITLNGGTYTGVTDQDQIRVGKNGADSYRAFVSFDLSFVGYYASISAANLTLTTYDTPVQERHINAFLFDYNVTPWTENTVTGNITEFDETFFQTDNISISVPATDDLEVGWTVTTHVQNWIQNRTVDYIGWRFCACNATASPEVEFYDSQSGTNSPGLEVTWTTDSLPPVVNVTNNHDWDTTSDITLSVYDQPTSAESGINQTSLSYSTGGSWLPVPTANVSWSDNSTFPRTVTLTDMLSEGTETDLRFALCDLAGNWGYSNTSSGPQYYPKFTGSYAYANSTETVLWGEDWTESTDYWKSLVGGGSNVSRSIETGVYNNAFRIEYRASAEDNYFYTNFSSYIDISQYNQITFWIKVNNTNFAYGSNNDIYFAFNSYSVFTDRWLFSNQFAATTTWQKITLPFTVVIPAGSPNQAQLGIIRVDLDYTINQNVSVWIDGLHFSSVSGDSWTDSVDVWDGQGTWRSYTEGYATPSLVTGTTGYESLKWIQNTTDSFDDPYLYFNTLLDLSSFDSFRIKMKANTSITLNYIRIETDGSNFIRTASASISLTTEWTTIEKTLATDFPISSGTLNQSSVRGILFRGGVANVELYIDALEFYASNTSYYSDVTEPQLGSLTLTDTAGPWDFLYVSGTTCYYSNDQTMNSSLNAALTVTDTGGSGLTSATATAWGDSPSNTLTGSSDDVSLTFYVETSENVSGSDVNATITITVLDVAGNSNTTTFSVYLDNTAPSAFTVTASFESYTGSRIPVIVSESTDALDVDYMISYGDTHVNSTTHGTVWLEHVEPGVITISGLAYDEVGNTVTAADLILLNNYEVTQSHVTTSWDPLDKVEETFRPLFPFLVQAAMIGMIVTGVVVLVRVRS
jgi:hypothetical protein